MNKDFFDITEQDMIDLSDLFKVFGDSSRIKIMNCIYNNKKCVSQIADELKMTHSAISHQLRNLKQARLVKSKKEGKEVYYVLDDEHIEKIFSLSLEHIKEAKNG